MNIQFIGAIADVTGSMTLLNCKDGQILIDCGLYQGTPDIQKKNWSPLPFSPQDIKAVLLTHAHLDHSGYIPRLVKMGFRGQIFCTKATKELAQIILVDSAKLMEAESIHHHNSPLYQMEDVMVATNLFTTKNFNDVFEILGMEITFVPAGHILGAASIHIKGEKIIIFSGDLGRKDDPLIFPPTPCPPADIIVLESTYGGRIRQSAMEDELHSFLKKIKKFSKVGIIASFAIERAQLLITLITEYYNLHPEDRVTFVIDGPMMTAANKIFKKHSSETKRPIDLYSSLDNVEVIEHLRQWNSLKKKEGPLLIVTSSGMLTGGRVWRYLENWQTDANACLFLPGFQALGTAGKELADGERRIKDLSGKEIHWQGEVISSSKSAAFSSHADQNELIEWLKYTTKETKIFLNHGEESSKELLKKKLNDLGYLDVIPIT